MDHQPGSDVGRHLAAELHALVGINQPDCGRGARAIKILRAAGADLGVEKRQRHRAIAEEIAFAETSEETYRGLATRLKVKVHAHVIGVDRLDGRIDGRAQGARTAQSSQVRIGTEDLVRSRLKEQVIADSEGSVRGEPELEVPVERFVEVVQWGRVG